MSEKLIIVNESNLPMTEVLLLVRDAVALGRISRKGRQYCFLISKQINGAEYHVVSDVNEKSDRFTIYKSKRK